MKNEPQTMLLFSPLFPHICSKNEWIDMDNYRKELSAGEILEYKDAEKGGTVFRMPLPWAIS